MTRRELVIGVVATVGLAAYGAWMAWGPSSAGHDPLTAQSGLVGVAATLIIGGAPVVSAIGVLTAPGPPSRRRTWAALGLLLLGAVLGMLAGGLAHAARWNGEVL